MSDPAEVEREIFTPSFPHEVYCKADRSLEIGCEACSCRAGHEIKKLRSQLVRAKEAARPFLNSLEAFKFHSDSTVITNSDMRRSGTMPNHYLTVRDLRGLSEAMTALTDESKS